MRKKNQDVPPPLPPHPPTLRLCRKNKTSRGFVTLDRLRKRLWQRHSQRHSQQCTYKARQRRHLFQEVGDTSVERARSLEVRPLLHLTDWIHLELKQENTKKRTHKTQKLRQIRTGRPCRAVVFTHEKKNTTQKTQRLQQIWTTVSSCCFS